MRLRYNGIGNLSLGVQRGIGDPINDPVLPPISGAQFIKLVAAVAIGGWALSFMSRALSGGKRGY